MTGQYKNDMEMVTHFRKIRDDVVENWVSVAGQVDKIFFRSAI